MSENIVNPMDRPCCANCNCFMIFNFPHADGHRELKFTVTGDCPHSKERPFKMFADYEDAPLELKLKDSSITEVSALLDYVCNSWKGRGKPFNIDEERGKK